MLSFILWMRASLHALPHTRCAGSYTALVAVCVALAAAPKANAITAASLTAANLAGKTLTFSITGGNAPFETIGNFDLVLGNTGTYTIPVSNGNTTLRSGSYTVAVDSFGTVLKLNGYLVNNSTVEVVIIPNSSPDRSSFEMYATGTNKNGNVVFAATTTAAPTTTTTTTTTAVPSISTDAQGVFDLAAELYPALFKGGSALQTYQGYIYKFFAASGIYVGIKDNAIFLMGGQFGSAITSKGSVTSVLNVLKTAKGNLATPTVPVVTTPAIPAVTTPVVTTPITPVVTTPVVTAPTTPLVTPPVVTTPTTPVVAPPVVTAPTTPIVTVPTAPTTPVVATPSIPAGSFKLSITGTVKDAKGVSQPVNSVTAYPDGPVVFDATDFESGVESFKEAMQSLGVTNITDLRTTVINNTAARQTVRGEFSATHPNLGAVSYDLTYDISK